MSSERQIDDSVSPWWGEHLHRYEEALKLIQGSNLFILDIACGSGFGSNFLASKGHTVIGGDISEETISECKKKYQKINLNFETLNGVDLPFENEKFDVVTSFETIEHTTQYLEMLSEFRRVVKKDGLIIISTPNFIINSPNGVLINKYHTQEWIYEELSELLNSVFSEVKISGQEYVRYKFNNTFRYRIGKIIEGLLYSRGIRKLPITLQDRIMKFIIGEQMYPLSSNFSFTEDIPDIKKCKTFFAICKP